MILGIDASLSATGMIILDKDGNLVKWLYPNKWSSKFPKGKAPRLTYYRQIILKVLEKYKIKYVALEDYAYGKRKGTMSFTIGELGGVIKQVAHEVSLVQPMKFMPVSVQHVKSWAGRITPSDVAKGKARCWKCGGKIKHRKCMGVSVLTSDKVPTLKELQKEWHCSNICCEAPYSLKSDVIQYVRKKVKLPWMPLKFSGINEAKAPAKFIEATEKVLSDLCDAYVIAEIVACRANKKLRKKLKQEQLAILGQF